MSKESFLAKNLKTMSKTITLNSRNEGLPILNQSSANNNDLNSEIRYLKSEVETLQQKLAT